MTRQFNVKDEVEVKDDLDKKPDSVSDDSLEFDVSDTLAKFLRDLQSLRRSSGYDSEWERTFYQRRTKPVVSFTAPAFLGPSRSTSLDRAAAEVVNKLDNERLRKLADITDNRKSEISIEFYPYISGLKLLISFEAVDTQKASALVDSLSIWFAARSNRTDDRFRKYIYENTEVISESNQIFIVTRLPRAGLDSLLATDAK